MTACRNCGAALRGPYCALCGQRHDPHVHSLGHFIGEALETLTHADSRLWRTLGTLLTRPGQLTQEFFAGRRVRQLPPFRLYLIVSVVFFLFASMLPADAPLQLARESDGAGESSSADPDGTPQQACEAIDIEGVGAAGAWLQPRLEAACARANADQGRSLESRIWSSLPRAMFVLMPLMAGLTMLLYWRPRRRYVEHLLLFVHNHTAVFIAIGVQLGATAVLPAAARSPASAAVAAYLTWYVYASMRRYYGQGRLRTLAKFALLLTTYSVLAILLFAATAAYAFLSA
jgi:hypothetical protein